jgi:integral membrane protein (TIGR01906 family)
MKKERKKEIALLAMILVISIPITLFLANYMALLSNDTYLNSLAASTSTYQDQEASKNIISYVKGTTPQISQLELFRPEELSHLQDVRTAISKSQLIFYSFITLILISISLIYFKTKSTYKTLYTLRKTIFKSGIITLAITALAALFSINFDSAFTAFHKVVFAGTTTIWQFPSHYALVNLFPAEFFVILARDIVLLSAFLGAALILVSLIFKCRFE